MFAVAGMPIFLGGVLLKRKAPGELVFDGWLATIFLYFFVVGHGNAVHEYYQLPLVLPACVFMGKVYGRYFRIEPNKPPLAAVGLTAMLIGILFFAYAGYEDYYMKAEDPANSPLYALGMAVQRATPAGSPIVAIDDGDPTLLYQMDRKGWHATPSDIDDAFLAARAKDGALYLAGLTEEFKDGSQKKLDRLLAGRAVVARTNDYFIVRLSSG